MGAKPKAAFLRAGLLAPVVGGVWAGLFSSAVMATTSEAFQSPSTFAFMLALTSIYASLIALPATWTLGLAWHGLACARGWRSIVAYTAFGFVAGSTIALLIYLLSEAVWTAATWLGLLWFGSTGAVIALTGWLIRRPDRDQSSPNDTSA
jgi:hypothetical protein